MSHLHFFSLPSCGFFFLGVVFALSILTKKQKGRSPAFRAKSVLTVTGTSSTHTAGLYPSLYLSLLPCTFDILVLVKLKKVITMRSLWKQMTACLLTFCTALSGMGWFVHLCSLCPFQAKRLGHPWVSQQLIWRAEVVGAGLLEDLGRH